MKSISKIIAFMGVAATASMLSPAVATAAENDFVGEWLLELKQDRRAMNGLLSIRNTEDGGYIAFVEGGPTRLVIKDENIEVAVDDWTGGGRPFERYFKGTINGDKITGTFAPEAPLTENQKALCIRLPLGCPYPTGTWEAERHTTVDTAGLAAKPVDLSGRWATALGGMRRWTADLNEVGQLWNAQYDDVLDLPRQRCVSSGLVNSFGSSPEIFQSEEKITMVMGSSVRRIYMDGRKPEEYSAHYPLGFSEGRWEGSTLVIETSYLQASVRGFMGNPISENATVTERMTLNNNGTLTNVMTLHDPEYYNEPHLRRVNWRKSSDITVSFPTLCDPDAFYREIFDNGQFPEYIKRSDRRF